MRLSRAAIVMKKDFSEFRKNRYIMATLLFMPLLVAVVLPMVYVVPINELGSQRDHPLDLEFDITASYDDVNFVNATASDLLIQNSTISNSVLQGCIIRNSTIVASNVNGSSVEFCRLRDSLFTNSNIYSPVENIHSSLMESQIMGQDDEMTRLKDIIFNVLLILLMMIPVTIPTVTASYSFVGEKTNKSLEPLLATPITDIELLVGKSGSIFFVSMGATWLSFAVCVVAVDMLTYPVLGYYPLPTAYWMTGVILLAPAMCMMSILANVLISSKVNDVRVSQQVGGIVVLPLVLFFISSFSGVIATGILPLILFTLLVIVGDLGILALSLRTFKREEILVNWK
jgi:hypothetical protein